MPFISRPPVCVASADAEVRRRAIEALEPLGHGVVEAGSLAELARVAAGARLALVDLRMPGLGDAPMSTLRAQPGLHGTHVLALREPEIAALTRGGADPAVVSLLMRVELQVAADIQVTLLHDVGRRLTALPEMAPTMEALLDVVAEHVPSDTATLFMVDTQGRLVARAARGYELDDLVLRAVPVGEGVVGWVVANRTPTIVGDSDVDARFASGGSRGSRSMLAAPILAGERVVGALTLVRRAPAEQFGDEDLTVLATIGAGAGVVLENARLFERERDVTERLLEVERTLDREREMLRKLETYDRLYTQVVATVSHELKTPLMGIRGFAKLLADGEADAEEARDFGREIHENAVRLSAYVEEILEEDAVHSGRMNLRIAAVDLGILAEDVVYSLRAAAGGDHELVDAVPRNLARVEGDTERLRQVLVNLVSNAIKYSPQGGRVEISAEADDGRVILTVTDEGIGIPADERARVFDRFYRVTNDDTRGIGGTGLGLSIVRGIVELHGGRIWVDEGEGGRGTRFRVSLPAAAPARVPGGDPAARLGGAGEAGDGDAAEPRRLVARPADRGRLARIGLLKEVPQ